MELNGDLSHCLLEEDQRGQAGDRARETGLIDRRESQGQEQAKRKAGGQAVRQELRQESQGQE